MKLRKSLVELCTNIQRFNNRNVIVKTKFPQLSPSKIHTLVNIKQVKCSELNFRHPQQVTVNARSINLTLYGKISTRRLQFLFKTILFSNTPKSVFLVVFQLIVTTAHSKQTILDVVSSTATINLNGDVVRLTSQLTNDLWIVLDVVFISLWNVTWSQSKHLTSQLSRKRLFVVFGINILTHITSDNARFRKHNGIVTKLLEQSQRKRNSLTDLSTKFDGLDTKVFAAQELIRWLVFKNAINANVNAHITLLELTLLDTHLPSLDGCEFQRIGVGMWFDFDNFFDCSDFHNFTLEYIVVEVNKKPTFRWVFVSYVDRYPTFCFIY